jgi:hypothetical protein
LTILLRFTHGLAQSFEQQVYSPFFNQFQLIPQSVNPAILPFKQKANLDLAVQFHPGAFSNFNSSFFAGNISISKKENKPKQMIGFMLKDDSEGKLLSRDFFYGTYGIQIPLSDKYTFSTGIQIGFASIVFQSTSITPGSSAYSADGNLGLQIQSEDVWFGLAYKQIFGSAMVNPGVNSVLKSYVNLLIGKKIKFSNLWQTKINILFQTDQFNTKALNTEYVYDEHYAALLSWNNRKGLGIGGALKQYPIWETKLLFGLTYYIPVGLTNRISINEFEFLGGIQF